MSFKISRTTATWGLPQLQELKRGKKNKVEGVNVPFSITGKADMLDKIIPYDVEKDKLSKHLFGEDDGRVLAPTVSLNCLTKLEGLSITIHDRKKPIVLKEVRLQEPKLELLSPWTVVFSSKIQLAEPDDDTMNRFRRMRGRNVDVEIVAEQTDMFDVKEEEAEENNKNVIPMPSKRKGKDKSDGDEARPQ
jgi:hypothetical protein